MNDEKIKSGILDVFGQFICLFLALGIAGVVQALNCEQILNYTMNICNAYFSLYIVYLIIRCIIECIYKRKGKELKKNLILKWLFSLSVEIMGFIVYLEYIFQCKNRGI